jgi:enoyl-CoA hydratase/carnithine racemase
LITEFLQLEKTEGIARLTLNNPARHNAVNFAMWNALPEVLKSVDDDPDIRVIILTGAGERSFCSGNGVAEFDAVRSTAAEVAHYNALQRAVCDRLATLPKVTIAMIDGYCLGAGLEFALQCDLRLCTPGARFAVPAARLGLPYRHEDLLKLLNIVGLARTKEMVLTGRQVDGATALAMGLVHQVEPTRAALSAAVAGLAREVADNAPLSIAAAKATLGEMIQRDRAADQALCQELADRCYASQDYEEGRRAFREKRKPHFAGR